MKSFKSLGLSSLMVVLFTMFSLSVSATSRYYSKAVVKAVGQGKVYVATNAVEEGTEIPYAEEATATQSSTNSGAQSYYLYAEAEEGYTFKGWFADEELTTPVTVENLGGIDYVEFDVRSTSEANPTTMTYYAKFVQVGGAVISCPDTHIYVNKGAETKNLSIVAENLTETLVYTSDNEAVATVAADGTVTGVSNGSAHIKAAADGLEVTFVVTVIDSETAGKTQIGNGDFEDWRGVTDNNHAPDNWNSFETNEGSLASLARAQQVQMVEDHRPGSNGLFCVDIYSRSVLGVAAQGNLTLGCINAGSASAANAANYNFSKISDEKKSETISRIPTALKVWVKFVPGRANANYPYARVAATVHDAHNYITYGQAKDDTDVNKSYAVAQAELNFEACDWTELTIPFTMTNNAVVEGQLYIIVNASTNATPGQGQTGDHLYIDDVELVYDTEFEEFPVVMPEDGFRTFVAPMAINVPFGMKAYTAESVNLDLTVSLTEVEGTIAANTPVVLEGEAVSRVAYGVSAAAEAQSGLLTGVHEDTTVPAGSYVIISNGESYNLAKIEEETQIKAGEAYVTAEAGDAAIAGAATAINGVGAAVQAGEQIFNLAGQRVSRMQKGINIVGGKKVLK